MKKKEKSIKISKEVEEQLKKLPGYLMMTVEARKSMIDSMVKMVQKD